MGNPADQLWWETPAMLAPAGTNRNRFVEQRSDQPDYEDGLRSGRLSLKTITEATNIEALR